MKNSTSNSLTIHSPAPDHSRWVIGGLVFLAIVVIGIASRFWLADMPNFKPVAALILFGGFFFRKTWPALIAVVLIMAISDLKLGVYEWSLAACVYASLALSCWLGVWVKRASNSGDESPGMARVGLRQAGRFAVASVVMSTTFYLLTNGAVWWMGQWYAGTWSGLVECYVAGLPFYRSTLMGDLLFTGVIVGAYAFGQVLVSRFSGSSFGNHLKFAAPSASGTQEFTELDPAKQPWLALGP